MAATVKNVDRMLNEMIRLTCNLEDQLNEVDITTPDGVDLVVNMYNILMIPKVTKLSTDNSNALWHKTKGTAKVKKAFKV